MLNQICSEAAICIKPVLIESRSKGSEEYSKGVSVFEGTPFLNVGGFNRRTKGKATHLGPNPKTDIPGPDMALKSVDSQAAPKVGTFVLWFRVSAIASTNKTT